MTSYIELIESNPDIILDHKFFIKYPDADYVTIKDIIKRKSIETTEFGKTHCVLSVFPINKSTDKDIIDFLYESHKDAIFYWENRSNYILSKIGESERLKNIVNEILCHNYDIEHPFMSFILSEYTYLKPEELKDLSIHYDVVLNSKAFYTHKDHMNIDQDYIVSKINIINPNNIPDNLRNNYILSLITESVIPGNNNDLFTPIENIDQEDFLLPDFDNTISEKDDHKWINTIKYWKEKNIKNIMDFTEVEIWNWYLTHKTEFVNKVKNNKQFAKKFLTISLIYKIIKDSPNLAILLPAQYLDIRHYVAIIRNNPKLINKVPLLLQKSTAFRELCGERYI